MHPTSLRSVSLLLSLAASVAGADPGLDYRREASKVDPARLAAVKIRGSFLSLFGRQNDNSCPVANEFVCADDTDICCPNGDSCCGPLYCCKPGSTCCNSDQGTCVAEGGDCCADGSTCDPGFVCVNQGGSISCAAGSGGGSGGSGGGGSGGGGGNNNGGGSGGGSGGSGGSGNGGSGSGSGGGNGNGGGGSGSGSGSGGSGGGSGGGSVTLVQTITWDYASYAWVTMATTFNGAKATFPGLTSKEITQTTVVTVVAANSEDASISLLDVSASLSTPAAATTAVDNPPPGYSSLLASYHLTGVTFGGGATGSSAGAAKTGGPNGGPAHNAAPSKFARTDIWGVSATVALGIFAGFAMILL